jgi:3D (Asp-Asp-Asp) domain-containing protein
MTMPAGATCGAVTALFLIGPLVLCSPAPLPAAPNSPQVALTRVAADHPLMPSIRSVMSSAPDKHPAWKLPLLLNGLTHDPVEAKLTGYCGRCSDGGGGKTRWGTRLRRGICAADPRYWGPGSVIWLGDPINEVVIVEDTGGAIKGPYRFDYCAQGNHDFCSEIGRRNTVCVPLLRVPPTSRWGTKPEGWQPPVPQVATELYDRVRQLVQLAQVVSGGIR